MGKRRQNLEVFYLLYHKIKLEEGTPLLEPRVVDKNAGKM